MVSNLMNSLEFLFSKIFIKSHEYLCHSLILDQNMLYNLAPKLSPLMQNKS